MKRYTIADIKRINEQAGHYFFSRDTMRFFGNTMRDFRVRHIDGKVYVINTMGGAVHSFNPYSGDVRCLPDDQIPYQISRADILTWQNRRLARSTFRWS